MLAAAATERGPETAKPLLLLVQRVANGDTRRWARHLGSSPGRSSAGGAGPLQCAMHDGMT